MVVKASKDLQMLWNEIMAIEQIQSYAKANKNNVSQKIADSIPKTYGRGIISIVKDNKEVEEAANESNNQNDYQNKRECQKTKNGEKCD